MSEKTDLRRTLDGYRARVGRFDVVEIPERRYLTIDGHGDPNTSPLYADALAALYPLAYSLKFESRGRGRDYAVPPLEGLWWADDMRAFTAARDKSQWRWRMMLVVPGWIDAETYAAAEMRVRARRSPPARLGEIRLGTLAEGLCVQTLHVGSFDDEAAVLARMHDEVIPARGLHLTGRHHEIYLGDPRRVAPERMRTILRQPVAR